MPAFRSRTTRSPEEVEVDRILSLPVREWPDAETLEIESFERLLVDAFSRGERLLPAQVAGIRAYEEAGGGLFPIGVGFGKTGIGLMVAQAAMRAGIRRILWLCPVQLVGSLVRRHLPEWRRRVLLSLTFHHLAGKSRAVRGRIVASGAPGVYVFPYSLLSVPDTLDLLFGIDAGLVIADEGHNLKNPRAARTGRLVHFLREMKPQLVVMSGTITSKRISDYHHLATAALRDRSPLPLSGHVAFRWGQVLDSHAGDQPMPHEAGVVHPLVSWARERFPNEREAFSDLTDGYRKAFWRRLTTAPGVVATSDVPGTSLRIRDVEVGSPSSELSALIGRVTADYETPCGEPIDHAIHCFKWCYELSAGFYNSLVWPTAEELAESRGISQDQAAELLARARDHLSAQQDYHRALRSFFEDAPPGLDTPREVGRAIAAGKLGEPELVSLWEEVRDRDFPGRPERRSVPVRVCDFKVRRAVEWAREVGSGILWVYHQEVGRWLTEELSAAGLDPLYCPAGADAEIEAVGDPVLGGRGDRIAVASVTAHGTGRNLQAFRDQMFVQWPRSAQMAEQALGRLHRTGQEADELVACTMLPLEFDAVCRAGTLNDALYVQQTTGAPQRVIYADYDPLPRIYSSSFLRERGASPRMLDATQQRMLGEKFGS
jgi:hypothetical protein